jgi:hypothetical protein
MTLGCQTSPQTFYFWIKTKVQISAEFKAILQEAFKGIKFNQTTRIAAHRLSRIKNICQSDSAISFGNFIFL